MYTPFTFALWFLLITNHEIFHLKLKGGPYLARSSLSTRLHLTEFESSAACLFKKLSGHGILLALHPFDNVHLKFKPLPGQRTETRVHDFGFFIRKVRANDADEFKIELNQDESHKIKLGDRCLRAVFEEGSRGLLGLAECDETDPNQKFELPAANKDIGQEDDTSGEYPPIDRDSDQNSDFDERSSSPDSISETSKYRNKVASGVTPHNLIPDNSSRLYHGKYQNNDQILAAYGNESRDHGNLRDSDTDKHSYTKGQLPYSHISAEHATAARIPEDFATLSHKISDYLNRIDIKLNAIMKNRPSGRTHSNSHSVGYPNKHFSESEMRKNGVSMADSDDGAQLSAQNLNVEESEPIFSRTDDVKGIEAQPLI